MTMNQLDLTSLASSGRVRFGFWPPNAATETFTETRPFFRYFPHKSQQKGWRRGSESNRRCSFCRAVPYHLATPPPLTKLQSAVGPTQFQVLSRSFYPLKPSLPRR